MDLGCQLKGVPTSAAWRDTAPLRKAPGCAGSRARRPLLGLYPQEGAWGPRRAGWAPPAGAPALRARRLGRHPRSSLGAARRPPGQTLPPAPSSPRADHRPPADPRTCYLPRSRTAPPPRAGAGCKSPSPFKPLSGKNSHSLGTGVGAQPLSPVRRCQGLKRPLCPLSRAWRQRQGPLGPRPLEAASGPPTS